MTVISHIEFHEKLDIAPVVAFTQTNHGFIYQRSMDGLAILSFALKRPSWYSKEKPVGNK